MASLLILGGLATFVLVLQAAKHALLGISIVVGVVVAEALLVKLPAVDVGVAIFPYDGVFGILACASVLRFLTRQTVGGSLTPWIVFVTVALFSFLRGVIAFGLQPAGVDFRIFFYLLSGCLYVGAFRLSDTDVERILQLLARTGGVLAAIAMLRWVALLFGVNIAGSWEGIAMGNQFRVLNAAQTFLIAQALVYFFVRSLPPIADRRASTVVAILLPVVLLLQHRTVWVSTAVVLLWLLWRERRASARLIRITVVSGICVLVIGGLLLQQELQSINTALAESASSTNTFLWRLEGWRVLLSEDYLVNGRDYAIGRPFGSGYERFVFGVVVNYSPHNFFIHAFLRTGMIGLSVVAVAILRLALRLHTSGDPCSVRTVMQAQLAMLFLDCLAYNPSVEQGILIGTALGTLDYAARRGLHSRALFGPERALDLRGLSAPQPGS